MPMTLEQIKAAIRLLPLEEQLDIAEWILATQGRADARRPLTGKELLESEIVGMWADREDIGGSAEFARKLREEAWGRGTLRGLIDATTATDEDFAEAKKIWERE